MADTSTKASANPAYQRGEQFNCPKCGYRTMQLRYCAGTTEIKKQADGTLETNYSCMHQVTGQHMHLICKDCGFHQFRNVTAK